MPRRLRAGEGCWRAGGEVIKVISPISTQVELWLGETSKQERFAAFGFDFTRALEDPALTRYIADMNAFPVMTRYGKAL